MLPKDSAERVKLNEDRARHWLVLVPSRLTVCIVFDMAGILERAPRNNPKKGEPGSNRSELKKKPPSWLKLSKQ